MADKKVSSIKLHIQTKAFYPYRANFNFLVEFLGVSTSQCRKEQIRSIKNKIRAVINVADFKYQHPVEINAHEKKSCRCASIQAIAYCTGQLILVALRHQFTILSVHYIGYQ